MPWRKYTPKEGKYGSIYHISQGVQVRSDARGKWTIFIERGGERRNKTIGAGREGLVKAIKAAEVMSKQLASSDRSTKAISTETAPITPAFKAYSEAWLEDNMGRWDSFTYQRYEGILRLHIWPYDEFKGRIDEVTRKVVKKRLQALTKTHSPATVELAHCVLHGIFEEAVDDEDMGTEANPATRLLKKILPPKNKRNVNEAAPFDLEERDRFLEYADKTLTWAERLILKVMVYGGLRLGEALAMRLRHFDPVKMMYHVSESFKQHRFGLPKKGKKRLVDLPEFLVEELNKYIVHLKKMGLKAGNGGGVDLLFLDPMENGYWPYSQRKVQGLMKRVCKGAKLSIRNPHDLRHTYASILLMSHQSPAYVQNQLGHSSITITVDIYGHWMPGQGRQGLEEALTGGKPHISAYKQERPQ